MAEKRLHVLGMTCGHCEAAVIDAVEKLAGVERVEASAKEERVAVIYGTQEPRWAEIASAIDAQGFDVVPGDA